MLGDVLLLHGWLGFGGIATGFGLVGLDRAEHAEVDVIFVGLFCLLLRDFGFQTFPLLSAHFGGELIEVDLLFTCGLHRTEHAETDVFLVALLDAFLRNL